MASQTVSALAAVERFNEAFGRGDVDASMVRMTEDRVFESNTPPDGERHAGQTPVRRCRQKLCFATCLMCGEPIPAPA